MRFRGMARVGLVWCLLWGISCVPRGTGFRATSAFCAEELGRLASLRRQEVSCVRQHPFLEMPVKLLREACEAGNSTYRWLSQGLWERERDCRRHFDRCKSLLKEVQEIHKVERELGCHLGGWSQSILSQYGFWMNTCVEKFDDFQEKVSGYRSRLERCQVRVPFCTQRIEDLRRWRLAQSDAGCRFPHRIFRVGLGKLKSHCLGKQRAFFLRNYHEAKRLHQQCMMHHEACRPLQKRWKAGCEESEKQGCGQAHPWCRLLQEWTPCVVWFQRFSRELEGLERSTASCVKNGARCRALYPKVQHLSKQVSSLSCGFRSFLLGQTKSAFVHTCLSDAAQVFSSVDALEKKVERCAKHIGHCEQLWALRTSMNKMLEHPKCSDLLFLSLRLGRRSMVSRCVLEPRLETMRWEQMWKRLQACSGQQAPWPLGIKK